AEPHRHPPRKAPPHPPRNSPPARAALRRARAGAPHPPGRDHAPRTRGLHPRPSASPVQPVGAHPALPCTPAHAQGPATPTTLPLDNLKEAIAPSPSDHLKNHRRGEPMTIRDGELLQGTLELMVLKALSLGSMHGWGLAQRIEQMSQEVFQVSQGSLYPALQRLKRKGWITSDWRVTENNRRARYYSLTPAGERALDREVARWHRASQAVNRVLAWEGGLP